MTLFRIFLAHAKGDSDQQIKWWCDHISRKIHASATHGTAFSIVLGRDDYEQNFKRCGSWDAWTQDVVDRIDHATRESVYHAIVVPHESIGAATAKIIENALVKSLPVIRIDEGGAFMRVVGVDRVSESYKDGWRLRYNVSQLDM